MKASEARQQWSQLLNKVFRDQTRVIVEKSGIPVAAVISAEDLERLKRLEEQRAQHFKVLNRIGEAFKDVPEEEIDHEVVRAVSEVRIKRRAKLGKRS
ncbi:MAG: type II toxin-antitoxin system Phd/YefM family antitoxin [Candidatus Blackburnbacteria bacterium]|nr:type II toxin-antitoxin system Phd/YefM family antitoxin [Candidatus Blackburnbacteria bacterium]